MGKKAGNNYRYYINNNGERVMRVTDVIKILAKEQLLLWSNALGFKGIKYRDELERTANIGSLCHDVLQNYFNPHRLAEVDYDKFGIEDYGDRAEVINALESFFVWYKNFTKLHTYSVKFTERVVVGENLGGTIDLGIDGWKNPKKVIFVDYKTSGDFYLTQFLQLAGYVTIYEEVEGPDTVEGIMVVRLSKKPGKKAEARYISREKLDPFILCFQCMLDVAVGTKILGASLRELTEVM